MQPIIKFTEKDSVFFAEVVTYPNPHPFAKVAALGSLMY